MALLEDIQSSFGGPRQVRFPTWATDELVSDVDGNEFTLRNARLLDRGGQVFNAASFGMSPDASVEVNDAALQAAMDLAGAVTGEVVIPGPSCNVSTHIIDQTMTITGWSQPLDSGSQLVTTANAPIFDVRAPCTIRGIAFKGDYSVSKTSQELVRISDTHDVKLQYCYFNLGYHNIRIDGTCFFLNFVGLTFNDAVNAHVRGTGTSDQGYELAMVDCRIRGGDHATNYLCLFDNLGTLNMTGCNFIHSNIQVAGVKVNTVALLYGGIKLNCGVFELEGIAGAPSLWLEGTALAPVRKVQSVGMNYGGSNEVGAPVVVLGWVAQSQFIGGTVYGIPGSRGFKFTHSVTKTSFIGVDYESGSYQFLADEAGVVVDGNLWIGCTADTSGGGTFYFHAVSPFVTVGNNTIIDCDLGIVSEIETLIDRPSFASGKVVKIDCPGYHKGALTAPSVPATTVAQQNTFDVPVTVYINGTITNVTVNGTTTNCAEKVIRVPVGGTIALTYGGSAPTWVWVGE